MGMPRNGLAAAVLMMACMAPCLGAGAAHVPAPGRGWPDPASGLALSRADRPVPCARVGRGGAGLTGGTGNADGPESCGTLPGR